MSAANLVQFWRTVSLSNTSSDHFLLHREDFAYLKSRINNISELLYPSGIHQPHDEPFDVNLTRWPEPSMHSIHKYLLPGPYGGCIKPEKGKVYLFMKNPGCSALDYGELTKGPFQDAILKTLYQNEIEKEQYPFIYLDPKFWWYPGSTYWRRKLNWLLDELKKEPRIEDASEYLSKKIVTIEPFPYHSGKFPDIALDVLKEMPSYNYLKAFVYNELLPMATSGEILLVFVRGNSLYWPGINKSDNIIVYQPKESRFGHFGENSKAGKQIRDFLISHVDQ